MLHIDVSGTLSVDGYIQSNSLAVDTERTGGGAGGSVIIQAVNFTGTLYN